jgi:hypothetical protein
MGARAQGFAGGLGSGMQGCARHEGNMYPRAEVVKPERERFDWKDGYAL